jgi:GT2 family glycosyltransferase
MDIDVVITNSSKERKSNSLYYTIRSVLAQSIQPHRIIISENNNCDEISSSVRDNFGDLIIIADATNKKRNISHARNIGALMGSSDIIIFIDNDLVIGKDDIFEKIIAKMKTNDFYCGAKRFWTSINWNNYLSPDFPINHIRNILKYKSFEPISINRETGRKEFKNYSYIGHFGAIRRKVFQDVGGFDEQYYGWTCQDTDLMMRLCLKKYSYDLMYNDNIEVFHLSHEANKLIDSKRNSKMFSIKKQQLGIQFNVGHFFGIFDNDSFDIIEHLTEIH